MLHRLDKIALDRSSGRGDKIGSTCPRKEVGMVPNERVGQEGPPGQWC
jgi:hypothetical protein